MLLPDANRPAKSIQKFPSSAFSPGRKCDWRVLTPSALALLEAVPMHTQPVFYDFEASGLAGFPVEIGWAWLDGDVVKSDSLHITPADNWDVLGNWDFGAEKIHGLSVSKLRLEGQPAVAVARRLNLCLAGCTLYSDSPLDIKWMTQLFAAARLEPSFKVHLMPAAELIDDARQRLVLSVEMAAEIAESVGSKFPYTHHAREDALYWAELWTAFSRNEHIGRPSPVHVSTRQGLQVTPITRP